MNADVVVVGGGTMGSAAAWWLARRGRHVILLERFEQGHVRGSSHGGTRIFRLAYADPAYVRLAQEALPLWRDLEDESGQTLLVTTGGIDHGPQPMLGSLAAGLAAAGASHRWLSPDEAAGRWPAMRFDEAVLYHPDAGRTFADLTVRTLQDRAQAHGATVRFGERVDQIIPAADGVVVRSDREEYRAPAAVVAVGPWAPGPLLATAGVPLPALTVTREQVFHFRPSAAGLSWPSFIHYADPVYYGLQTPGEGVKVGEHRTGAVTDADHRSFDVDAAGRDRVCRYVAAWLPGLEPEPVTSTTCLYTNAPNQDFVIDRRGPLVVAAGFSGHGFKFTPLVGRLLADLAVDPGASGPPRFRLPTTSG
jgi:sarcosine oxidase